MGDEQVSVEDVQRRHSDELMSIDGVEGVGVGEDDGEPTINVYVGRMSTALTEAIPDRIEGFRTKLEASGEFSAG